MLALSRLRIGWVLFSLALSAGLVLSADLVLSASRASAQDSAQRTETRAVFAQASEHHEDGRYVLAAEAFQRAYDLLLAAEGEQRAALIQFNLGTSLDEIPGREREARDAYVRFLEEASPDEEVVRVRAETVRARIRELEARLRASSGASLSPVGPVLLGVGGAALVTGIILGAVGFAEGQDLAAQCPSSVGCPERLRSLEADANTLANVGDALWIGGAVVAAAGLVLTLLLSDEGGGGERAALRELRVRGALGGGTITLNGSF